MPSKPQAVLIADIVDSSSRTNFRNTLSEKLAAISRRHRQQKLILLPYSVTAGDEFQTVAASLSATPAIILDLRAALQPLPIRIGVGFGDITDRIEPPVNRLGGPAFQLARQAIEDVKKRRLFRFDVATAFHSSVAYFDETINLVYGLHDTLALQITPKQWESIGKALLHPESSVAQTAKQLALDASTVSRNLKRGYYWQLLETVKGAESLIKEAFK
ncbi:MAG TPA: SatD family protein [Candidatus Saccharimonadales bacterium]|nr:SatD family protein [Candidatus Saccharimonadales bacterium]